MRQSRCGQGAPNPFNPSTTVSFTIPQPGNVTIDIYNAAGQKVAAVADGFMSAGNHSVTWDASGFSAGVYFYTVKAGYVSKTMKMTLLK
ncbi:T9SS type A sorting domain-containing protein [bacterium]|nr:T9SS type A sorting domain-containing protein [bacterium]